MNLTLCQPTKLWCCCYIRLTDEKTRTWRLCGWIEGCSMHVRGWPAWGRPVSREHGGWETVGEAVAVYQYIYKWFFQYCQTKLQCNTGHQHRYSSAPVGSSSFSRRRRRKFGMIAAVHVCRVSLLIVPMLNIWINIMDYSSSKLNKRIPKIPFNEYPFNRLLSERKETTFFVFLAENPQHTVFYILSVFFFFFFCVCVCGFCLSLWK